MEGDTQTQVEESEIGSGASTDLGLLIELIQNYQFLYDLKHKDYKNNNVKEQAWKEISQILQTSVEDCMRHWKNLRDRFNKENRLSKSGSAAPESNWLWADKMIFYGKYTKPRKTFTATPSTSRAPSRQDSVASTSRSASPGPWSTMDTIFSPSTDGDEEPVQTESVKTPKNIKAKKRKQEDIQLIDVAKQIAESLTSATSHSLNVNKKFCEYAFARLQEMPEAEAQEKRKKMLLILEQ